MCLFQLSIFIAYIPGAVSTDIAKKVIYLLIIILEFSIFYHILYHPLRINLFVDLRSV